MILARSVSFSHLSSTSFWKSSNFSLTWDAVLIYSRTGNESTSRWTISSYSELLRIKLLGLFWTLAFKICLVFVKSVFRNLIFWPDFCADVLTVLLVASSGFPDFWAGASSSYYDWTRWFFGMMGSISSSALEISSSFKASICSSSWSRGLSSMFMLSSLRGQLDYKDQLFRKIVF